MTNTVIFESIHGLIAHRISTILNEHHYQVCIHTHIGVYEIYNAELSYVGKFETRAMGTKGSITFEMNIDDFTYSIDKVHYGRFNDEPMNLRLNSFFVALSDYLTILKK